MRRRDFIALTSVTALFPRAALAQQPAAKVPRIAILGLPLTTVRSDAIRRSLTDHGYVDGKNIIVTWSLAPTNNDMPAYAAMAVAAKPDVILCTTTPAIQSAKGLTSAVPIVMFGINDPIGGGFIESLAHPGSNVTGTSRTAPDLIVKQLAVLKELVPTMRRVAILYVPADSSSVSQLAQVRTAAQLLNIEPVVFDFIETQDLNTQLERVAGADVQAFCTVATTYFLNNDDGLFRFEIRTRLPRMTGNPTVTPFLGVIAFGPNDLALYRQSFDYVDAILKGAKPADLAVGEPTVFDLALNLATARTIGLTIPASIHAQATVVVDEDYRAGR